jgi:hypothetical protein
VEPVQDARLGLAHGGRRHAEVAGDNDEDFTIRDSSVGYIDSALPANQVRLRSDSAYHITRPNRAEPTR